MLSNGRHDLLPVDQIQQDLSNPRIARILEMYDRDEITPERLFLALGASGGDEKEGGPTFTKLKESMRACKTIINPVIVNKTNDGTYICVDGNCRVALYKEFLVNDVPGEWGAIPAIVYEGLGATEIDTIRLQAHLVGPRPWDPYSKAKYLDQLRRTQHIPYPVLVDYCGGSQREIRELIDAYNDMESYYRPVLADDSEFDPRRFSGFKELQKPGVKEAIVAAGHSIGDFAQWIHDGRIGPLREVRALPKIMKSKRAHEVFLKQGAAAAVKTLETPSLSKALQEASLPNLCRALIAAYDRIGYKEAKSLKEEPGSPDALAVVEAFEALRELAYDIAGEE